MRYSTPLRYPGGKSKIANYIKYILSINKLEDIHYVEPYAGGAGLALNLLFDGFADHIHINDISMALYAFWYSVLEDTDNLCRLIYDTSITMESWYHQKIIQENVLQYSTLELGFSTFFLNRTNRSGIIRGGVIGGKNQKGNWPIDARFNKSDLIFRIEKISRYRDKISLYNYDAIEFISKIVMKLSTRSLIYFDPPYYSRGRKLYENYYHRDDHVAISKFIKNINKKWIVSYDDTPEISQLYKPYRRLKYQLSYSAGDRYKGQEIMFFCDDLIIPPIDNPTRIKINRGNLIFF